MRQSTGASGAEVPKTKEKEGRKDDEEADVVDKPPQVPEDKAGRLEASS